jgi:uncharacterized protein
MLYLQDLANQGQQEQNLVLDSRLPQFIESPCTLRTVFHLEPQQGFHLLHLHTQGELTLLCQRCMTPFVYAYENTTKLALCPNEEKATELMQVYECVVAHNGQLDLTALVTDELHLYAPEFHPNREDCN